MCLLTNSLNADDENIFLQYLIYKLESNKKDCVNVPPRKALVTFSIDDFILFCSFLQIYTLRR